jgi:S-adenosylmethionine synthetase
MTKNAPRRAGVHQAANTRSSIDRSAAYAARYVAKNVVAAGLAARAEVRVAYAIGVARPVSVLVDTFGTERVGWRQIEKLVNEHFDLRPAAFRSYLNLHQPIYSPTAAYGHFGRTDIALPWERTDRAAILRSEAGL